MAILVFIDTQVFRSLSFDWSHPDLLSLKKRTQKGSIKVLTSDIVVQECEKQLHSMLNEYQQAIRKAQHKATFLKSVGKRSIELLSEASASTPEVDRIKSTVNDFFDGVGAMRLAYPESSESLFKLYFDGAAPFGTKGKKSEFPDAANLLSLMKHSEETSHKIIVVSGDEDWRRVGERHENISHVKTLAEALNQGIALEWTDADLWSDEDLLQYITRNKPKLDQIIAEALKYDSRVNLGDGSLNSLQIYSIEPTHFVTTDIWQTRSTIKCRGELTYDVGFHAEISIGDDELNNELEQDVVGDEELVVALEIEFQIDNLKDIIILSASHTDGLELELNMDV